MIQTGAVQRSWCIFVLQKKAWHKCPQYSLIHEVILMQLIAFAHGYNVTSAATSPGMSAAGSGDIYFGG